MYFFNIHVSHFICVAKLNPKTQVRECRRQLGRRQRRVVVYVHLYIYVSHFISVTKINPEIQVCECRRQLGRRQRRVAVYVHLYISVSHFICVVKLNPKTQVRECRLQLVTRQRRVVAYVHLNIHDSYYTCSYGVATISRLLRIIGLFCKRALWKRRYSAKETYDFKEPTNRSHPEPQPLNTCV